MCGRYDNLTQTSWFATQVTYNGWPLYYFSADFDGGHTRGYDIEANGPDRPPKRPRSDSNQW